MGMSITYIVEDNDNKFLFETNNPDEIINLCICHIERNDNKYSKYNYCDPKQIKLIKTLSIGCSKQLDQNYYDKLHYFTIKTILNIDFNKFILEPYFYEGKL